MIRLDDTREADESLVTHAEYQLFIDDMHAQGEYYQPDHWQSYQFSPGQGREPVVGVRPSDAATCCDWLTGRTNDGWKYRMPYGGELPPLGTQETRAGYWTVSYGSCSIESQHEVSLDGDEVSRLRVGLALDGCLASDLAADTTGTPDLALALHAAVWRVLNRAPGGDRDTDLKHARDLARRLDLAMKRVRGLAIESTLDLARYRACAPTLDLDRTLDRARAYAVSFDLADIVEPSRSQHTRAKLVDISIACTSAYNRFHEIARARPETYLDIYLDMVMLQGRREGKLPAFEGIRLVREPRTRRGS